VYGVMDTIATRGAVEIIQEILSIRSYWTGLRRLQNQVGIAMGVVE